MQPDELDRDIAAVLAALAKIVNQAIADQSRKVPAILLYEARQALTKFKDSEFTTEAIQQACT